MKRILPLKDVIRLSQELAAYLGISFGDKNALLNELTSTRFPVTLRRGGYRLWIDKHYVAYSHEDEEDVHYAYVTAQHIHEERRSFEEAGRLHRREIRIPEDIERQFTQAMSRMREEGSEYCVFEKRIVNIQK